MRCREAVRMISGNIESQSGVPDESLRRHLDSCARCSRLAAELAETWQALGQVPEIEISPDFARKVYALIDDAAAAKRRSWWPFFVPGWEWMALAACVLLVAVLALPLFSTLHGRPDGITNTDRWDESFMQDLEQSLNRSDAQYLPDYDDWSSDTGGSDPLKEVPRDSKQKGESRNEKS